jgi:phosphoribosylanthranilate isomerase
MSLLVKICGLSTPESLDVALDEGADMVGFVFFPPSPRHVDPLGARQLFQRARGRAKIAALLVDADQGLLDEVICELGPDLIQLHGSESPERVAAIRTDAEPIQIMKAIGVTSAADFDCMGAYEPVADMILLDAKAPAGARLPGGNGAPFDWRLFTGQKLRKPFLLSGGLTPENVPEAIRLASAAPGFMGVDVSSGIESAPGEKDLDKIRSFIRAARAAGTSPLPQGASGRAGS